MFISEHLAIKAHIDYDIVKGSDDKDHIKLKKYKFEFDVKENGHYHLTNLFNGNKQLSKYWYRTYGDRQART